MAILVYTMSPMQRLAREMETLPLQQSRASSPPHDSTLTRDNARTKWCGPCKMIGPLVEELAGDYEGNAIIAKLNVDENPETTARFGVRSIPTLLVFKNGQIVDKQIGAVPKSVLAGKLQAQVA